MVKLIFSVGSCALQVLNLSAQVLPPSPPVVGIKSFSKGLMVDEWKMWSSPFQLSNYNSRAVKKYLVPFAVISTALILSDQKSAKLLPNTTNQILWNSRISQFGAYTTVAMAGSTYLLGKFGGDDHAKEAGLLSLEALAHSQVASFAIKELTNRERPLDHDGRGRFWAGGNAFPSGHAASAFAVATVFAYEYRDHIAVPIVAYSLASLISVSRAGARRHWASDIFVGSSVGFMIGRFTYRRNHDPALPGSKVSRTDRLIPQVGFGRNGPRLSWVF